MRTRPIIIRVLIALALLFCASTAPAEGLYVQGGLRAGAVITGRVFPAGGIGLGAGYALPLGAGELSLGLETGFAVSGMFTAIPAALSAGYDLALSETLSLGGGLLAGGFLVLGAGVQVSPLIGGRLRAELKQPGGPAQSAKAAGLYAAAGLDLAPETAGAALLPAFEIGLRFRPGARTN